MQLTVKRAPTTTRTPDPLITSQVLYQLSYKGYARRRLNDQRALGKTICLLFASDA